MTSKVMREKIEWLKSAGFTVSLAEPREARERGYVDSKYVAHSDYYRTDDSRPYVEFGERDEDYYGQSSTVERSNFRSIVRDFPGIIVPVSYSNVNALGAFVHDMTDELINVMIGLREEYPVYDESDLSELESEEITKAFSLYLFADWYRSASEEWQEVADLVGGSFMDDYAEMRDAFFQATYDADYYPGHDGNQVRWDDAKVDACMVTALCALVSKYFAPTDSDAPVLF